jgi:streptomycin adenylyltransferase
LDSQSNIQRRAVTLGGAPQRILIDRGCRVAAEDSRVLAAWLSGSYATGLADQYSDVDLNYVVVDEAASWFKDHWAEVAERIAGPLILASRIPGIIGGYTLNADWSHLDLVVHPLAGFDSAQVTSMLPLYDSTGSLLPETLEVYDITQPGQPYYPDDVVNFFYYLLGNLVVTFGRQELIVAHGGIQALKDRLVELMLAERGIRKRGGQKRLNPFLSDEQRRVLEAIPGAAVNQTEITVAVQVISAEFSHRARRLARSTSSSWPQVLHDATMNHLDSHLGTHFAALLRN